MAVSINSWKQKQRKRLLHKTEADRTKIDGRNAHQSSTRGRLDPDDQATCPTPGIKHSHCLPKTIYSTQRQQALHHAGGGLLPGRIDLAAAFFLLHEHPPSSRRQVIINLRRLCHHHPPPARPSSGLLCFFLLFRQNLAAPDQQPTVLLVFLRHGLYPRRCPAAAGQDEQTGFGLWQQRRR